MALRARTLFLACLAAFPCLALAHNGRDGAPPPLSVWQRGMAQARATQAQELRTPSGASQDQTGKFVDIYAGIVVRTDPKTGVRSYIQVGDVPANPARARVNADASGPGVGYWVDKEFQKNHSAPAEDAYAYQAPPAPQIESYDEGNYGGYLPAYGYGYGDGGRPGGDHGRPGHGGGGGDHPPPRSNWGVIQQPYRPSPPPGPYGGGVGSPTPYNDRGVGAPEPENRYNSLRPRRG